MAKRIPDSLKPHILPFNWDVRQVWALATPAVRVVRCQYDYLLDLPLWSSVQGCGMLFDISPMAVIRDPAASPYQTGRIAQTDICHPLDFLLYGGHSWILDGVHRLAKHHILGSETIMARFHPPTQIPIIRLGE